MTNEEKTELAVVASRLNVVASELNEVAARVDDLEDDREVIVNLPTKVAEIKGMVTTLQGLVTQGFDGVQKPLQQAAESSSTKNAIQFAAIVLVPIIVALIGAIVTIKVGSR